MSDSCSLTLHAANRILEREVPVESLHLLPMVEGMLNEKPLRVTFKASRITVIARKAEDGRPRLISAWRL